LNKADLSLANLKDANLVSTDLSGSNLRDATLNGADLSLANVDKALFGYNSGLSAEMKLDLVGQGAVFKDATGVSVKSLAPSRFAKGHENSEAPVSAARRDRIQGDSMTRQRPRS